MLSWIVGTSSCEFSKSADNYAFIMFRLVHCLPCSLSELDIIVAVCSVFGLTLNFKPVCCLSCSFASCCLITHKNMSADWYAPNIAENLTLLLPLLFAVSINAWLVFINAFWTLDLSLSMLYQCLALLMLYQCLNFLMLYQCLTRELWKCKWTRCKTVVHIHDCWLYFRVQVHTNE